MEKRTFPASSQEGFTKVLGRIQLREKKRRKHLGQGKNMSAKCWGSVLFKKTNTETHCSRLRETKKTSQLNAMHKPRLNQKFFFFWSIGYYWTIGKI